MGNDVYLVPSFFKNLDVVNPKNCFEAFMGKKLILSDKNDIDQNIYEFLLNAASKTIDDKNKPRVIRQLHPKNLKKLLAIAHDLALKNQQLDKAYEFKKQLDEIRDKNPIFVDYLSFEDNLENGGASYVTKALGVGLLVLGSASLAIWLKNLSNSIDLSNQNSFVSNLNLNLTNNSVFENNGLKNDQLGVNADLVIEQQKIEPIDPLIKFARPDLNFTHNLVCESNGLKNDQLVVNTDLVIEQQKIESIDPLIKFARPDLNLTQNLVCENNDLKNDQLVVNTDLVIEKQKIETLDSLIKVSIKEKDAFLIDFSKINPSNIIQMLNDHCLYSNNYGDVYITNKVSSDESHKFKYNFPFKYSIGIVYAEEIQYGYPRAEERKFTMNDEGKVESYGNLYENFDSFLESLMRNKIIDHKKSYINGCGLKYFSFDRFTFNYASDEYNLNKLIKKYGKPLNKI